MSRDGGVTVRVLDREYVIAAGEGGLPLLPRGPLPRPTVRGSPSSSR